MTRHLFNVLTALSLVLCAGAALLSLDGPTTSRTFERIDPGPGGGIGGAYTFGGRIFLGSLRGVSGVSTQEAGWRVGTQRGWSRGMLHFYFITGRGRQWIGCAR